MLTVSVGGGGGVCDDRWAVKMGRRRALRYVCAVRLLEHGGKRGGGHEEHPCRSVV